MISAISYPPIPIFEVGPLSLSLHGVFAALGFLVGAILAIREARSRGFDAEKYSSVLTWALVGAILGARLFTVPAHWSEPGFGWSDVVGLAGSFSILGGMAGGILGGMLRMRLLNLDVAVYLDFGAIGLAVGTIIGRIGDLAIVEHLGSETTFFLGYAIKGGYDVAPQHDVLECVGDGVVCGTYHHTGLYDMILAMVLLGFLVWLRRRWTTRSYGQMFSAWLAWYGFQRFVIDFARLDGANADATIGAITWSQLSGLLAGIFGLLLTWWLGKRNEQISPEADQGRGAQPLEFVDHQSAAEGRS